MNDENKLYIAVSFFLIFALIAGFTLGRDIGKEEGICIGLTFAHDVVFYSVDNNYNNPNDIIKQEMMVNATQECKWRPLE